jgi:outer membrane immunogenic protein
MRKLLLSAAAAILIASPAFAADLGVRAPPPAPAFIATPWDGFYIGGNVGFGTTDFSLDASGFRGADTFSQRASGVLGGVQLGYNRQFGTFVFGIETDFQATGIEETTFDTTAKVPWFGTTRLRAGFLVTPAFLIYGTGGVAYGHAEVSAPLVSITVPGVGWAAGAGIEYALGGGWSIGAEYLHVELNGPTADIGALSVTTSATTDLGRAKINYKF